MIFLIEIPDEVIFFVAVVRVRLGRTVGAAAGALSLHAHVLRFALGAQSAVLVTIIG